MDIEKEFQAIYGAEPPHTVYGTIPQGGGFRVIQHQENSAEAYTWRCKKEGYLAAAAPRDLLIEQLVAALKTCESGEDWQLHDEKIVDAALSAAKERGYE